MHNFVIFAGVGIWMGRFFGIWRNLSFFKGPSKWMGDLYIAHWFGNMVITKLTPFQCQGVA